jgi:hypothetical protein
VLCHTRIQKSQNRTIDRSGKQRTIITHHLHTDGE